MTVIVTWDDAKALDYCSRGLRQWFAEHPEHGTYLDFIQHGMPLEDARRIDDAMVQRIADYAERRANGW